MALSVSGSVPLALPGGEAQTVHKLAPAPDALLARTPAKGEIAFAQHKHGMKTPAFWKPSKRAFGGKK